MSVHIDPEVFARLVGANLDRNVLLFEVSRDFVDQADSGEWSDPVLFRFVRREGAKVELEFHRVDLTAVSVPPEAA